MKFKMAAAAILNSSFLSILVKWSISGGSRLDHCKISFIYVSRRLSYLCKNPRWRPPPFTGPELKSILSPNSLPWQLGLAGKKF